MTNSTLALIAVTINMLTLTLIGVMAVTDENNRKLYKRFRQPRIVPSGAFESREAMAAWMKDHLGVEPVDWKVDMIMSLKNSRIRQFKPHPLDRGYSLKKRDDV